MKALIIYILFTLLGFAAYAQPINRLHAKKSDVPPKAILVMLHTEGNRINYFTQKGQTDKVKKLQIANGRQMHDMVTDFNKHFRACPFYYFIDTNVRLIKERQFSGVLLDTNLNPATNIILSASDTNYFIVYYGEHGTYNDKEAAQNDMYNTDYSSTDLPSLYAVRYNFQRMPMGYPDQCRIFFHFAPGKRVYSKEFRDIRYQPLALYYSKNLKSFYRIGKVPRKSRKAHRIDRT